MAGRACTGHLLSWLCFDFAFFFVVEGEAVFALLCEVATRFWIVDELGLD